MASAARALASGAREPSKVISRLFSTYSPYLKTKSGLMVPASLVPKESRSEKVIAFIKKHWKEMDERSKNNMFDLLGKGLMIAVSGGGTVMLSTTLLQRMDKLEAKVDESLKELKTSVADLKVQVAKSDEEIDAKYHRLQTEVNGLSDALEKVNAGATGPVVSTGET